MSDRADRATRVLAGLRNPEYTGENRCLPCTVVNAAIAVVASALAALVAVELAVAMFVCATIVIAVRGYLVPGTPTLTERYLPDRVLAYFDAHPVEREPGALEADGTAEDGRNAERSAVDPERFLLEVGAVEPCADRPDLCLTDEFADAVERRAKRYRDGSVGRENAAPLFDVEPTAVSITEGTHPEIGVGNQVRTWPSRAALVADVATHEALDDRTDRWTSVPREQRLELLRSLRSFHERCPRCSGEVALSAETVDSCCRSYEVVTVGCTDCEEPLLELDPSAVGTEATGSGVRS